MGRTPRVRRHPSGGWWITGLAAMMAVMPVSAPAGTTHGQIGVIGGYDTSILGDSTAIKDGMYSANGSLDWTGRLAPGVPASLGGNYAYTGYPGNPDEARHRTGLDAGVGLRLFEGLSLRLEAEGDAYLQPAVKELDSYGAVVAPLVAARPFPSILIEVSFRPGTELYPNYDLDNRTNSIAARVHQELGLDGSIELRGSSGRTDFTERRLYMDTAGNTADILRSDEEKEAELRTRWEIEPVLLTGICHWHRLESNGNHLDYGPFQYPDYNAVAGDERLVADYYRYTDREAGFGIEMRISSHLHFRAGHRWRETEYERRIAKDALDQFRSGDPARLDQRRIIDAGVDLLMGRYTATATWVHQETDSNDSLYAFTRDRATLAIRRTF